MRRLALSLLLSLALVLGPGLALVAAPADAAGPVRTLSISGTGVAMYPAFSPSITRYAATTTDATGGALTVAATSSTETVLVNGHKVTGPTRVTGLTAGDEVSVIFQGSSVSKAYSVFYLPAGYPALTLATPRANLPQLEPGLVGMTLNVFSNTGQPAFDTIVDRNGVPAYAAKGAQVNLDLEQQPTGDLTIFRPSTRAGHVDVKMVTLDDKMQEVASHEVISPLTNTDGHDGELLPDGSVILTGYEPNAETGKIDATIQKLNSAGEQTFFWSSASIADETMSAAGTADYAHINSVQSVGNGDIIASFRHFSAVLRIATVAQPELGYEPGDIIWRLGGRHSNFSFPNDPYPGGPCAQHTAQELINGHILLFDNGTSGLCVDPDNPAGPGINRSKTRISEYALDTSTHTATLVWSYAPEDRFALFAGSARRMSNGDTLIGWASERRALATEVNTAGAKLWELTVPEVPSGQQKYTTYRAELITAYHDHIAPVVRSTLAEGKTYVSGTRVPFTPTCTDRGGSNLTSCSVTGIRAGVLDTTVAGAHTLTVKGTDGAGNTTTLTRHFTVTAAHRPDGRVTRSNGTLIGNNIYGGSSGQTVTRGVRRNHSTSARWSVQNDGKRADVLVLKAPRSNQRLILRYFIGSREVTRAIVAGTYRTSLLQPGAAVGVRVLVKARRGSPTGSQKLNLVATSRDQVTAYDRVAVTVTVRR